MFIDDEYDNSRTLQIFKEILNKREFDGCPAYFESLKKPATQPLYISLCGQLHHERELHRKKTCHLD